MDIQKRVLTIIAGLACVFCSRSVLAQQTLTADSLYTLARTAAFVQKDYSTAISLAKQGLVKNPGYTDIRIFLGRVYTWNGSVDSAREVYQSLLQQNEHGQDIYLGYADAEMSDEQNAVALDIVNNGLVHNPASARLLIKEAAIMLGMNRKKEALQIVDSVLILEPQNKQAKDLKLDIKESMARNNIGIKYDYVSFDKQFVDPWHLASIEYSRITDSSTYTARINYANRFRQDGMQYELEGYPHFSRTFYGFFNLGYSDKAGVFPKWKAGASLFANLPKAFEAELGLRYLYFFSESYILTGYVG